MDVVNGHQTWPYNLNPHDYGLGRHEYENALRVHREREHADVMREQRDAHAKRMAEIAAERESRRWWLQPLLAFSKWSGGAFWIAMWAYLILIATMTFSEWQAKTDAQWCLKDLTKCQRHAGPGFELKGESAK